MTIFAMLMAPEEARFFAMCMGNETHYHVVYDHAALHRALDAGATG